MESNSDEIFTVVSAGTDGFGGGVLGGEEATQSVKFRLPVEGEEKVPSLERVKKEVWSQGASSWSPQSMVEGLAKLEIANEEALRRLDFAIAIYSREKQSDSMVRQGLEKVRRSLGLQSTVGAHLQRGLVQTIDVVESLSREVGALRALVGQVLRVVEESKEEECEQRDRVLARIAQVEEDRSRSTGHGGSSEIRVVTGKEFKNTVSRFLGFVDSVSKADKVNQRVAFRKWGVDLREYALLSRLGMSVELIMNNLGEEPKVLLRAWEGYERSVGHSVAVVAAQQAERAMKVLERESMIYHLVRM